MMPVIVAGLISAALQDRWQMAAAARDSGARPGR